MHKFPFEKLEVWRLAKELVKQVYKATKKFPSEERFGLIAQINRAAISVASILAEGSARVSRKDQAHFSQMSYASLMELTCQLTVAVELGYLSSVDNEGLRRTIEEISNKLNALRKYQTRENQLNTSTIQQFNNLNR